MGRKASSFSEDIKRAGELHKWNKRILSIGGMWPLEPTYLKFYISYLYFIVHMIFAIADFVSVFGDISAMIGNLLETVIEVMVGIKMIVLRHSSLLRTVLNDVQSVVNENHYSDKTEIKLYMAYNRIGRNFFVLLNVLIVLTCGFYQLRPVEDILEMVLRNETVLYILPYRMHLLFNITDWRTYTFLFIYQLPMFYYHYIYGISSTFLCTFIVHVAGEMSILAHRIRTIDPSDNSENYYVTTESTFREIVRKHYKIIWTATAIDDVFSLVLLEELVIMTIILGLISYRLVTTTFEESMFEYCMILNYLSCQLLIIFIYCIIGEYLAQESTNLQDACYECQWYKMPSKFRSYIIICMCRLRKPLQLSAGQFYVFSLSRFTNVLKTAMAYLSMMRAVA